MVACQILTTHEQAAIYSRNNVETMFKGHCFQETFPIICHKPRVGIVEIKVARLPAF